MPLSSCPPDSPGVPQARSKVSLIEKCFRALSIAFFALPLICLATIALLDVAVEMEVITPRLRSLISADVAALSVVAAILIMVVCFAAAIPENRQPD